MTNSKRIFEYSDTRSDKKGYSFNHKRTRCASVSKIVQEITAKIKLNCIYRYTC